ncbi:MAG TPA: response regulator [Xanthobacteraceae bacterium]|nr:response regulator [Xanthobacteraceae bacterium]
MEPVRKMPNPIHVLVVEDEFLISDWVAQSLAEQGFAVLTAATADEALQRLISDPVDVLFTDINLPGSMDGAALAWRARQMQPCLPVVYASARATMIGPNDRVPGAVIVPKPYEPTLVGKLLAAVMKSAVAQTPA